MQPPRSPALPDKVPPEWEDDGWPLSRRPQGSGQDRWPGNPLVEPNLAVQTGEPSPNECSIFVMMTGIGCLNELAVWEPHEVNTNRGLFRAWMATSVLWLLATAPVSVYLSSTVHEPPNVAQVPDPTGNDEFDPFDSPKSLADELRQEGRRSVEWVREWHWPRLRLLLLVAVPPFLLLALAGAGYWVAQGFRDETKRSRRVDSYPEPRI